MICCVVIVAVLVALLSNSAVSLPLQQQQQQQFPTWQSNESLANMMTPSEREHFGYPTITPLNSSQMDSGFKGSSSFQKTDPATWMNLFKKLNNNQQVNVHVFGGSMTVGHRCRGRKRKVELDPEKICAWQFR